MAIHAGGNWFIRRVSRGTAEVHKGDAGGWYLRMPEGSASEGEPASTPPAQLGSL